MVLDIEFGITKGREYREEWQRLYGKRQSRRIIRKSFSNIIVNLL